MLHHDFRLSFPISRRDQTAKNSTERIQQEKKRISTMPFFLLWHFFLPGDKIENCSAQFLAGPAGLSASSFKVSCAPAMV